MITKSRAIILRVTKYNDSMQIVDAYTEKGGLRGFIVKIPKTRKARVKNVLFTPMAIMELEWNDRATARLQHVRYAAPLQIYSDIPFSPAKTSLTLFLSEFLSATLRAPIADERIFNFVYTSMLWLDAEQGSCANFHIVFLLHLSVYLGLEPNVENAGEGKYFDMVNGLFSDLRPQGDYIAPSEAAYIPMLMRLKYATAQRIRFTRIQRAQLLRGIIRYYSLHIPSFPELKSPDILQEVFG